MVSRVRRFVEIRREEAVMSSCVKKYSSSSAGPLVVCGRACVVQVAAVVVLAGTVGAAVQPPATGTVACGKATRPVAAACGRRQWSPACLPAPIECPRNGVEGTVFAAVRRSIRRGYDRASSLTWLPDVEERLRLLEEHGRRAAEERAKPPAGESGRGVLPVSSSGAKQEQGR